MRLRYRIIILFVGSSFCSGLRIVAQPVITYKIETTKRFQTMEHFGASDAWSMQYLGLWSKEKQKQIADWLFSTENEKDGAPKGIGLSLWRFNVGAGSTEQGESSQIASPWMRTECFLLPDGTYDWTKQQGQRSFLRLAKERGVNIFLAFLNSPPVYFTQNGLATNTGRGGTLNLKPEYYNEHVRFMADVIQGIEKHDGIKFNYISPFNEPDGHWNWLGPKQEGSPATNREVVKTVRLLSREFANRKLDTQILVNESSDYRCMYNTHMANWERGYQIQSFFSSDSIDTYLGDATNVPRLMVGHSYWTNTPLKALRDIRCQLRDTLRRYDVGFWQTETCIMANDEEIGGGGGFDRTMKTALYVARIIHHDIVYAGASSWQWWRSVGGNYKDGLIREHSNIDGLDGFVEDSKLMWALGNYSRFIRPEAVRLSISAFDCSGKQLVEGDTDQHGLMCSAYVNLDGTYVLVIINYADADKKIEFEQTIATHSIWKQYRTSDVKDENLRYLGVIKENKMVSIPKRSIVTLVSEKE